MENYIVINGKKAELTPEQLDKLGIKPTSKSPFGERRINETYYLVNSIGQISCYNDCNDDCDKRSYETTNYFLDIKFANQVALHQELYRKLLKFKYENEAIKVTNGTNTYQIRYSPFSKLFQVNALYGAKSIMGLTFYDKNICWRAIKEVIRPFIGNHPEFEIDF